jgi:serine/threonine protein kinase
LSESPHDFFYIFANMELSEKYRIIQVLGNQAVRKFGTVSLIEDTKTGELKVLKQLVLHEQNQHLAMRLEREASFTFEMNGLPRVTEFLQSERELLLIKSFADGIPLDEYWQSIPKKRRIDALINILKALAPLFQHLKKEQIVHCDIKPSNILIDKKENSISCHLIDFGMAIRRQEDQNLKLLFPLGYAAPELILNRLALIDHTTDLYALGIAIWKLFAGSLPLTHPNPSIFTNLQLTYPLPDHHALPKGLYRILQKMCVKHQFRNAPNRMPVDEVDANLRSAQSLRYADISEVILDLEQLSEKRSWWPF